MTVAFANPPLRGSTASSSSSGLASTGLPVRLHISLIASRKVVIAVAASVAGAKSRICGTQDGRIPSSNRRRRVPSAIDPNPSQAEETPLPSKALFRFSLKRLPSSLTSPSYHTRPPGTETTITYWADAPSKHTLIGRARCRLDLRCLRRGLHSADSKPTALQTLPIKAVTSANATGAPGLRMYLAHDESRHHRVIRTYRTGRTVRRWVMRHTTRVFLISRVPGWSR